MHAIPISPLFAAEEVSGATTTTLQYDLPKSFEQWLLFVVVAGLLLAYVGWMYVRDTRQMSPVWMVWLLMLRTAVLVGLAVIYFNPHHRTQKVVYRPSRVAVLVDRSLSMEFPAVNLAEGRSDAGTDRPSRSEAVVKLLAETDLLRKLSETHQVHFYTFSRALEEGPEKIPSQAAPPIAVEPGRQPETPANATGGEPVAAHPGVKPAGATDDPEAREARREFWQKWVGPRQDDRDTRLGEALVELVREFRQDTDAGIVVITDGASNAGVSYTAAIAAAGGGASKVKLYTVGVGSTDPPRNLAVSGIEAPSLVHTDDGFEIIAYVQGQNFEDEDVQVVLKSQRLEGEGEAPLEEVESRTVTLHEDGVPVKVVFDQKHDQPQRFRYVIEARPARSVTEVSDDDNVRDASVTVSDRRTRVLIVAGGPMRDYRFLTSSLQRHDGVLVDAYLQSVEEGTFDAVSQNVNELLQEFPATMEELNGDPAREDDETGYDVIVFFDPDWKELAARQPDMVPLLTRWVSEFSGGVIFVAGDVFTPDLATANNTLDPIRALYPVTLSPKLFFDLPGEADSNQAWPVLLTPAGRSAGFLQIADSPQESLELWEKEFPGLYRAYPTAGEKAGATVYAHFGDSRMMDEYGRPILLASQIYGSGRTMYLGSGETWRLRELDPDYQDRLWTKMIREVGQGRRSRGSSPVTLLPEKKEVMLGETVVVRAIVLENQDGDLKPSGAETVKMRLIAPDGQEIFPEPTLYKSQTQPGEFVGDFRATDAGKYRLLLPVPGTEDRYREETVDVEFPGLEQISSQRNTRVLTELARQTGGEYLEIDKAAESLPGLLVDKSITEPRLQKTDSLWDRQWVLYLLVGLLSLEWLSRKLLRLA